MDSLIAGATALAVARMPSRVPSISTMRTRWPHSSWAALAASLGRRALHPGPCPLTDLLARDLGQERHDCEYDAADYLIVDRQHRLGTGIMLSSAPEGFAS